MFILRRITGEGNENNEVLGKSYNLVRKFENEKEYEYTLNCWLRELKKDDDNIYGFIIHNGGQIIIPLYLKSVYFVMCSDGKTFANITHR